MNGVGACLVLLVCQDLGLTLGMYWRKGLRRCEVLVAESGRGFLILFDCSVAVVMLVLTSQRHRSEASKGSKSIEEMHA